VGEIPIPIVEALPTTEPPKYIWWPSFAWHAVAAEHAGLIKRKKESSSVKF